MRQKFIYLVLLISQICFAQNDSTISPKSFIVPVSFITLGSIASYTNLGTDLNLEIKSILHKPNNHTKIDDYLVASPSLAVYGLNLLGIKGEHNFKERTLIIGTSYLILYPIVYGTKEVTSIKRPDGSTYNSFPSGHTAFAFASAEFLRREYKDVSPIYGIAGYAVASTVAGLRIYNNRHWFSDVTAGAGLGILSTQVGYMVQPWLSDKIFKGKTTAILAPRVSSRYQGITFSMQF